MKSERAYLIIMSPMVILISGLILWQGLTGTNILFGGLILLIGLEFLWKGLCFESAYVRSRHRSALMMAGTGAAMMPFGVAMHLSDISFTSLLGAVLFCIFGASYLAIGLKTVRERGACLLRDASQPFKSMRTPTDMSFGPTAEEGATTDLK